MILSVVLVGGAYAGLGKSPSGQDVINLAQAYILAAILYVSILPLFQEPKLTFEYESLVWKEIVLKDRGGSTIVSKILCLSVVNDQSRLSKRARACSVGFNSPGETDVYQLPIRSSPDLTFEFPNTSIDPASAVAVFSALKEACLSTKPFSLNRGTSETVVIGFTLEAKAQFIIAASRLSIVEFFDSVTTGKGTKSSSKEQASKPFFVAINGKDTATIHTKWPIALTNVGGQFSAGFVEGYRVVKLG